MAVLAVAVCAVLSGARSYLATAEWAHDLPAAVGHRMAHRARHDATRTHAAVAMAEL